MKIKITAENNGKTVFQILKNQLYVSSKTLTKLKKKSGGILVNGEHVTVRKILSGGDILEINDSDEAGERNPYLVPVERELDIIYEDDDITVVNKPPDMPTHTSLNHHDDTLANFLAFRYREKESYIFRPVNRLDKNTSGLVLTANTKYSASRLSDMLQKGEIEKKYLAVLDGELKIQEGKIDNFIKRKYESIIIREQFDEYIDGSDRAVTEFRCISVKDGISVVEATPVTGRTHQLRVHFSNLGCPILGDDLYGTPSLQPNGKPMIERQALHAYKLNFTHPVTGEYLTLTAPVPNDINQILKSRNIQI